MDLSHCISHIHKCRMGVDSMCTSCYIVYSSLCQYTSKKVPALLHKMLTLNHDNNTRS